GVHDDATSPSASGLVAIRAQPVRDEIEEGEGVALAEELSLRTRRKPDDVALRAQIGGRLPRDAEVVVLVAGHHLLPVAPDTIVLTEWAATRHVGARPVHVEVRRVLG